MKTCREGAGWFCVMCFPRRAIVAYLVAGLSYIGFLWVVFRLLP